MIFLLVIVIYAALLSCGGSDSVMIFLFCQFHSSPLLTIDFRSLLSTGSQCVFFSSKNLVDLKGLICLLTCNDSCIRVSV